VAQSDWLSAAVRASAVERKLASGETLFRAGTKTVGLFEVISGKVRLARGDRSGREAVLQGPQAAKRWLKHRYFRRPIIATPLPQLKLWFVSIRKRSFSRSWSAIRNSRVRLPPGLLSK
jgi:CRP-like cAMP-binding protein